MPQSGAPLAKAFFSCSESLITFQKFGKLKSRLSLLVVSPSNKKKKEKRRKTKKNEEKRRKEKKREEKKREEKKREGTEASRLLSRDCVREGGERRENKGEGRKNGEDKRLRTKPG